MDIEPSYEEEITLNISSESISKKTDLLIKLIYPPIRI